MKNLKRWRNFAIRIPFKMTKKILITGSTGFVGSHLLPKFLNGGYQILEITRNISKSTELFGDKTFKIEINDPLFKDRIIEFKPEIVIHLASYLTASDQWKDIQKLIDTNLLFLSKVLNAVSETDLKLFINTGSFSEYYHGNKLLEPAYFYAATKTASRSLIDYFSNTYNFKQASVIPYTIYGGNDSQKKIIDLLFDSTNNITPFDLSPGEQVLDFIHVDDVTDFYLLLVENVAKIDNKSVFKLGTGKGYTLKQVAQLIEEVTCKKTNINWGGREYRKTDIMFAVADIETEKIKFNWSPKISLIDGIQKKMNY
jgi:nucleoside-diphosphate-sugar epimerase